MSNKCAAGRTYAVTIRVDLERQLKEKQNGTTNTKKKNRIRIYQN